MRYIPAKTRAKHIDDIYFFKLFNPMYPGERGRQDMFSSNTVKVFIHMALNYILSVLNKFGFGANLIS